MTQKALQSWHEERRSAYLYRVIAEEELDAKLKQLFSHLAQEAEAQALLWQKVLLDTDSSLAKEYSPEFYQPELRARIVACLIRKLGTRRIKPVLAAIKIRGLSAFSNINESSNRQIGFHPTPASVEDVGASHRGIGKSGGLRAAVFGVNDGLVSVACLVLGVAGAAVSNGAILITGIAGLLAGAFSMAAGEYISMRSQREMFEYQIALERAELTQYPEEEANELTLIYMARGMHAEEASALAQRMIADPEMGLDILAREELGLNPDELGSPWQAAGASFLAFMLGGLIPLMPFLLQMHQFALQACIGLTALTLFGVGMALSLYSGRSALWGGTRMLLIGGLAGAMTYLIGNFMGTTLS